MGDLELVDEIEEVVSPDPEAYRESARDEAETIKSEIAAGTFDNPQAIIGLEYEFYAISDPGTPDPTHASSPSDAGYLKRVPRELLEFIRFEKELGLHNAEMRTSPLPFNSEGVRAQGDQIRSQLRSANEYLRTENMRIVSDGLLTISPEGEDPTTYLTASVEHDGYVIATNMSDAARYHAMANAPGEVQPSLHLQAPNVSLAADTVMPESLTTSIQPHFQVPRARDLPEFFQYAIRVAGPLLALGVNSPFFPPSLYDEVPPEKIIEDSWAENRILVFESVMNDPDADPGKVRFPRDFETVEEAIDRIATDPVIVPMKPEQKGRYDDRFSTFRQKHGTYWRWVRPVFDGETRSAANARIEFRPLPAQPTVHDTVAFQAAFAGLMMALTTESHPVNGLEWSAAKSNFYAAAEAGLDANLEWILASGDRTEDPEAIFTDLLQHAVSGLRAAGLSDEDIGRLIGPLRRRVRHGVTPASWKRDRVREELLEGATLSEAIEAMQRRYLMRQRETLLDGDFGAWIELQHYRAN